ncbi:MAG TPA: bifunctional UDP-3-O-[3-hydroxymyristoyl] N-acetylglucosamine deacetylase/3-hydroxyacyl-ACP dehydratase [Gemmatimonadales bacterium]|nr:bifunctional UDP-3-O-[3-hydroxymyristoyl] N-acetylglucosamine deacetylase/3-hydroxyacyl-ACP dehydratase [Gemmatimonadales bacterium]
MARRTIERDASLSGAGLHTGRKVTATFRPAPSGRRVVFRRTDLKGTPEIAARLEEVEATDRRTVLGQGDQAVHTVEHVLAAVGALGIDDLYIDLDGPEPPILDGSFRPWLEALQGAGTREQDGDPVVYRVLAPFTVTEGASSYVVSPAAAGRVTVAIDFAHPLIGSQAGSYEVTPEAFARELAGARTFGFVHEVEGLKAKGLIQGATAENAVVLTETGLVEGTTLRWPDEFVRHKAADLIGDLSLIGGRVEAHIVATRPSHQGNVALARAIARTGQRDGGIAMDIGRILDVIPHRYPFLLVDRIIEIEGKKRIVGIKNVTINEPFFQGHFPGHPIMPGVLIIEAMAQVGGMLLLGSLMENIEEKVIYFMSLDKVKFRRPVLPGDQLRFELEMLQFRGKTCKMQGVAYVDGKVAVEAEMMAAVVDR